MDSRKRGRAFVGFHGNRGIKKSKPEMESLSTGVGSKSKPCTKFFSTAGCPFGEGCHFLHLFPGGYNAVVQTMNPPPVVPPASRNVPAAPPVVNGSGPAVKTRMCSKYNTVERCKYGDKCHFAHGQLELGKPIGPTHDDPRAMGPIPGHIGGRREPPPSGPVASFGAIASTKISVDASLAGAIIGKGGVNSKQIHRQTGAKLSIREHESDPNLRNIELEGSFEQIGQATAMVRQLIVNVGPTSGPAKAAGWQGGAGHNRGSNYKTKLCDNFAKGNCTFGERCHFAHSAAELRRTVV